MLTWKQLYKIISEMSEEEREREISVVYCSSLGNFHEGKTLFIRDKKEVYLEVDSSTVI